MQMTVPQLKKAMDELEIEYGLHDRKALLQATLRDWLRGDPAAVFKLKGETPPATHIPSMAEQQAIELCRSVDQSHTKYGNVVHYLKNLSKSDVRIVIFSQYADTLHRLKQVLKEQDIKYVHVDIQGSVQK
eukprot:TRINITY_DN3895_c0_g1_i2.p2 TRINITY_DN3895_c0_g1~~TRINITY_DN3895_c0_g1_i2.p2  ORF type:complete len:131 (-),score=45.54 TRINITY_DN3895_c0_g1_i2:361-753(-)